MSHYSTSSYCPEAQYGGVAIDRPWVVYQDPTVHIDRPMPYVANKRIPYVMEPAITVLDQPPIILAQPVRSMDSELGSPGGCSPSRVYEQAMQQKGSPVRDNQLSRQQMGSPLSGSRPDSPVALHRAEPTSSSSPARAALDPSSLSSDVSSSAQAQSHTHSVSSPAAVASPASYPAPYLSPKQTMPALMEKPVDMDSIEIQVEAPSKAASAVTQPSQTTIPVVAHHAEDALERINVSNPVPVSGKPPKKTLKSRISKLFVFRKKKNKDSTAAATASTSA